MIFFCSLPVYDLVLYCGLHADLREITNVCMSVREGEGVLGEEGGGEGRAGRERERSCVCMYVCTYT